MQWNINNVPEQKQRSHPEMINQSAVSKPEDTSNLQLNIRTFKQYKTQYIALLLLLLQILLTVILFVLFMTLNYIGFGKVNQTFKSQKIYFDQGNCTDPYLQQVRKFTPIKIKTAFISLAVQLVLAFINIILGFTWTMNLIKNQRRRNSKSEKLRELRNESRVLNILIPCCIILIGLIFGTYCQFTVIANKTKYNTECKLNVTSKELSTLTSLVGIKLGLYLIIWLILMCVTTSINKIFQNDPDDGQGMRLPEINQLKSVYIEDHNRMIRESRITQARNQATGNKVSSDDDLLFKPLKTEQFLLQLKNNDKYRRALEEGILHNANDFQARQNHNLRRPEIQAEELQSDRRMMVYQPLESEKYTTQRNIEREKEDPDPMTIPVTINLKENNYDGWEKRPSVDYSVKKNLEKQRQKAKQRQKNGQLLIDSISRPSIDKLPITSKKRSFDELGTGENMGRSKVRFNFGSNEENDDIQLNFHPINQNPQASNRSILHQSGKSLQSSRKIMNQPSSKSLQSSRKILHQPSSKSLQSSRKIQDASSNNLPSSKHHTLYPKKNIQQPPIKNSYVPNKNYLEPPNYVSNSGGQHEYYPFKDHAKQVRVVSHNQLNQINQVDFAIPQIRKVQSVQFKQYREKTPSIDLMMRPPIMKSRNKLPKVEVDEREHGHYPKPEPNEVKSIIMGLDSFNNDMARYT